MGNLKYKLEYLFRQYLIRKEKERLTPTYVSYGGGYHHTSNSWMQEDDNYDGVIYFYEWSDTNRSPQLFYKVGAFDAFLRRSNIFMPPFQKEIIRQLDRAYVTCKKGTHDLLIRGNRPMLLDAVARADAQGVDFDTAGRAIMGSQYQNQSPPPVGLGFNPIGSGSRRPPMYNGHPEEWY